VEPEPVYRCERCRCPAAGGASRSTCR
jgi:hypothetical protein